MEIDPKTIDVIYQVIGGVVIGVISFWITSKIRPLTIKKDALQRTMDQTLLPINKIVEYPTKDIDEIIVSVKEIETIMVKNPFNSPPTHEDKIRDIENLIKIYSGFTTESKSKHIAAERIKAEYSNYKYMFHQQCNYTRKQLGYPYNSFIDFLRYKTGTPFLAILLVIIMFVFWLFVYALLFIAGKKSVGLVWLIFPVVLFLLYELISTYINKKGGLSLCIEDIKNKRKLKKDSLVTSSNAGKKKTNHKNAKKNK